MFNSQGHIATGSLQVEETSAYCTVNHQDTVLFYKGHVSGESTLCKSSWHIKRRKILYQTTHLGFFLFFFWQSQLDEEGFQEYW